MAQRASFPRCWTRSTSPSWVHSLHSGITCTVNTAAMTGSQSHPGTYQHSHTCRQDDLSTQIITHCRDGISATSNAMHGDIPRSITATLAPYPAARRADEMPPATSAARINPTSLHFTAAWEAGSSQQPRISNNTLTAASTDHKVVEMTRG